MRGDPRLPTGRKDDPRRPCDTLSPREGEVLKWLGDGLTNKEIAVQIGTNVETVKVHVYRMFDKMGFETRLQAALYVYDKEAGAQQRELRSELDRMTAERDKWKARCSLGNCLV